MTPIFRWIALTGLLLLPLVTRAQVPVDSTTGKITYTEVVPVPGVPAADLFARAQQWAQTRVQAPRPLPDSATHQLAVLGQLTRERNGTLGKLTLGQFQYQLNLATRDNRYRVELVVYQYDRMEGNRVLERVPLPADASRLNRSMRDKLNEDLDAAVRSYLAALKQHMVAKPAEPAAQPKPATPAKDW